MSMTPYKALLVSGVLAAFAAPAAAQSNFVPPDEEESEEELEQTKYDIRLTSTTFGYRETGQTGPALAPGTTPPENASPVNRIFTDLRAQVRAFHVSGSKWDYRLDLRLRQNNSGPKTSNLQDEEDATVPVQSGTFGRASEVDLREVYLVRRGSKSDWYIGRQMVLELAATKIDGIRVVYDKDEKWDYFAFAGAYPVRGSRSILNDYPREAPDPAAADPTAEGNRIAPLAVGAGGSYRFRKAHGSLGAGSIFPLTEESDGGQLEKPRVFVSSNGYWRRSNTLDAYHYVVVDLQSARDKIGFNNVLLGANWHPRYTFRVRASLSHIDTETLNAQAKARLEEPDAAGGARIQNNAAVLRIATQSARLGVSTSFKEQRFELSVNGRLRKRSSFDVLGTDGTVTTFPETQAGEVSLGVVDRRSFYRLRLFGTVSSIFGVGDANLNRTEAKIFRIGGARPFNDGRTEIDADITYLATDDDNQGAMGTTCLAGNVNPLDCYGTSTVRSIQANALVFHQLNPKWFLVGSVSIGRMKITSADAMGQPISQPITLMTSAFLRIDYKYR